MSQQGSKLVKDGVQVIQGTPKDPITRATLFLRLWRTPGPKKTEVTRATLSMVRPGRADYVIKELIPDMELGPQAALDKADRDREARRRCDDLPERRPRPLPKARLAAG